MTRTDTLRIHEIVLDTSMSLRGSEALDELLLRSLAQSERMSVIFDSTVRIRIVSEGGVHHPNIRIGSHRMGFEPVITPCFETKNTMKIDSHGLRVGSKTEAHTRVVFLKISNLHKISADAFVSVMSPKRKLVLTFKKERVQSEKLKFCASLVLMCSEDTKKETLETLYSDLRQVAGGSGTRIRPLSSKRLRSNFANEFMWVPDRHTDNVFTLAELSSLIRKRLPVRNPDYHSSPPTTPPLEDPKLCSASHMSTANVTREEETLSGVEEEGKHNDGYDIFEHDVPPHEIPDIKPSTPPLPVRASHHTPTARRNNRVSPRPTMNQARTAQEETLARRGVLMASVLNALRDMGWDVRPTSMPSWDFEADVSGVLIVGLISEGELTKTRVRDAMRGWDTQKRRTLTPMIFAPSWSTDAGMICQDSSVQLCCIADLLDQPLVH